jgi:hypothetical protein
MGQRSNIEVCRLIMDILPIYLQIISTYSTHRSRVRVALKLIILRNIHLSYSKVTGKYREKARLLNFPGLHPDLLDSCKHAVQFSFRKCDHSGPSMRTGVGVFSLFELFYQLFHLSGVTGCSPFDRCPACKGLADLFRNPCILFNFS